MPSSTLIPFDRSIFDRRRTGWAVVAGGSAAIAAVATHRAMKAAWRLIRGDDPPMNPAAHDTEWSEAVIWTATMGMAAGLSALLARRAAASGWYHVTGEWPPVE